jgi:two-component system response regulator CpxR
MKTVLVVEDTEDLRNFFMEVLRQDGYQVLGAENGRAALDILHSRRTEPCLVLLDMTMPVMDGHEFLQAVHEVHRVAPLPIVVLSAGVTEEGMRGGTRFVKKPVAPSALTTIVREYCGLP